MSILNIEIEKSLFHANPWKELLVFNRRLFITFINNIYSYQCIYVLVVSFFLFVFANERMEGLRMTKRKGRIVLTEIAMWLCELDRTDSPALIELNLRYNDVGDPRSVREIVHIVLIHCTRYWHRSIKYYLCVCVCDCDDTSFFHMKFYFQKDKFN